MRKALGGGLLVAAYALTATPALAHKHRRVIVERYQPEVVVVRPHHWHHPRPVYIVPVRPRPPVYVYDDDYGGGYRYPYRGNSVDLGTGIRLD